MSWTRSQNCLTSFRDIRYGVRYGMSHPPFLPAAKDGFVYPSPPRGHWALLLFALIAAESLVFWFVPQSYRAFSIYAVAAAWPIYLCIWIRKIDQRSSSLYWAIASLVTGFGFLFSWMLWIVVIFELREELLEHYNRREPMGLRLNWFLSLFFSFVYYQFALNKISREKESTEEAFATESSSSVTA